MLIQVVTTIIQLSLLILTVTGSKTEERDMHILDVVCVEEGEYHTIDNWVYELSKKGGNEQGNLRTLAERIKFGSGGMLYDFFTEMRESSGNTSLDVPRLKKLLQHNSLPSYNLHPNQRLTGWNKHILDVVYVKVGKYKTLDDLYLNLGDDYSDKELKSGDRGIVINGRIINISEKLKDEINLREFARIAGFGTGGLWYDFFADMDDPEPVMSPTLVLNCFDILNLANYLQPSPKMVNRFWEWFLGGVEAYFQKYRNRKAKIKKMLREIVKESDLTGVRELQAKRKGRPVSAIEVLYCFDRLIFDFVCLVPDNPSIQMRINSFMLYFMVSAASLGKIANNFKHLISVPFENSGLFKIDTFDDGGWSTKVNPEHYDAYHFYIDKRDLDSLKNNINITSFWKAVRRQVLSLGFRILNPVINVNNNPKNILTREDIIIGYDVAGVAENDVLRVFTFGTNGNCEDALVEYGFSDTSRLSIYVIGWYVGLANYLLEKLKHLKTARELELVFFKEWNEDLSKEIAELKRGIESMVKNGEIESCNLVLGTKVVNAHSIKYISKIEPYGIKCIESWRPSFDWEAVCDSIRGEQWKDMRFELERDYAKFMARLKGVKQEVGEHKWRLERLSLKLETPQPVTIIKLIRDIEDIMPYAESLFVYGRWYDTILTLDQNNIGDTKRFNYFEFTYKNLSSPEPTLEDKLQATTSESTGKTKKSSLRELAVYKMALGKEDAIGLASLPLRKLYLHICPASKKTSLLPIILDLNSELAKSLRYVTVFYWHSTPKDKKAGDAFIKAKEKEGVFISIRYMRKKK